MITLYRLLSAVALVIALPFLLPWVLLSARRRAGLCERLTPLGRSCEAEIWLHLASVGEAEAASPLLAELRRRGIRVVATTQTVAGREVLRRRFPGLASRLSPIDLGPLVRRSLARVGPRVLVLVETELWPSLIREAHRLGTAVVLVGARISDRSFPRYRLLRGLLRPVLQTFSEVGARSGEDADRLVALGVPADRVRIVGDLKLDRSVPRPPGAELLASVGPGPLLLAGSTHPGEEEILLDAWQGLRAGGAAKLRLLLAPRHVERAAALVALARSRGVEVELRTRGAASAEVVILDTIGELVSLYGVADLVVVGGSLVPVGGHNLLEPVCAGRVVVHGPHVQNQRSQLELLRPLGVLREVRSPEELRTALERLWSDPDRHASARAATSVIERHRGATARSLEIVLGALRPGSPRA